MMLNNYPSIATTQLPTIKTMLTTIKSKSGKAMQVEVNPPTHSKDVTWYRIWDAYYACYDWLSHDYLIACGYTLPAPLAINYTHKNVLQP